MAYQVLARKWRPQIFQQMVGQEHVLKALGNALDRDQLHHAYLFSGTRGVGKTTVARIFAKSLNCETGVTSKPCGRCSACTEIAEGRFVDLIEIDAASRTKVDDMRELLENAQYAPTRSRYKIYLIDEVHMLSNSSFNALLKTLEEPPPHIKFLLATTDPQKLPVTVLSRCLQFNLKNLSSERIVNHLKIVLQAEEISSEEAALWEIAKAANGSMRDALSLTDQCIAFSNGALAASDVLEMLGTVDSRVVVELLQSVATNKAPNVLERIGKIAEYSPDFGSILQSMAELLHRIAIEQVVPGAIDNSLGDQQQIGELAQQLSAEQTQLYYEIALLTRRDLNLAPDPRTGFEMGLLRMLAFCPNASSSSQISSVVIKEDGPEDQDEEEEPSARLDKHQQPAKDDKPQNLIVPDQFFTDNVEPVDSAEIQENRVSAAQEARTSRRSETFSHAEVQSSQPALQSNIASTANPQVVAMDATSPETHANSTEALSSGRDVETDHRPSVTSADASELSEPKLRNSRWSEVVEKLNLQGLTYNLAKRCILKEVQGEKVDFVIDEDHFDFFNQLQQNRLTDALSEYLGKNVRISVNAGKSEWLSPLQKYEAQRAELLSKAEREINEDPNIRHLIDMFDATVVKDSIEPIIKSSQ